MTMNPNVVEVDLGSQMAKILPDDVSVPFHEFWNTIPIDADLLTKTYLFRGWYITCLLQGYRPKIGECPCCQRLFKENAVPT